MKPTHLIKALAAAVMIIGLGGPLSAAGKPVLLRNGRIITVSGQTIPGGDILIQGTKIARLGQSLAAPPEAEVIDLGGRWVMPGIIDSHSHIALEGEVNESGELLTPEVDVRDVINPEDMNIFYALTGGVTSIHTMHGSANPIGGRGIALKLRWGKSAAELVFAGAPLTSKWALGENPKRSNASGMGPARYPRTRMGVEQSIREEFEKARDYTRAWAEYEKKATAAKESKGRTAPPLPPRKDYRLEAVAEILSGKLWVRCHAYQSEEMLSIMRLCREYGVKLVCFEHGLEGYRITNELKAQGVAVSTFADFWAYKWEAFNTMPQAAALCARRGVLVALNSDDPERMRHLFNDAAKTVRFGGASEDEAIRMLTINPAKILGVDRWVGTIEPGKDADLAVFSRHPLDPFTVCELTMVDGTVYFDRARYLADMKKAEDGAKPKGEPEKMSAAEASEGGMAKETLSSFPPLQGRERAGDIESESLGKGLRQERGSAGYIAPPSSVSNKPNRLFIKNATVVPVVGESIEGGSILVEDGKIKAVGKEIEAPAGAQVIDATGMFVYPGFIDAYSRYGLMEVGAISSTTDFREMGRDNPELRVSWAINPHSVHFGTGRVTGTTTALVAPAGGTFPGISALVRMDGWTLPEMAIREEATSFINFPMTPRPPKEGATAQKEAGEDVTSKLVEKIRDTLKEARRYLELKALAAADPAVRAPAHNPKYEALEPVFAGRLPVIISVEKAKDIELAIKFVKQEKLRAIFRGCAQGYKVADKIKQAGVPVIIDSLYTGPSEPEDGYDAPYRNVVELARAGVPICFSSGDDPSQGKDLPYHAAKAVGFGLPREEAIRALTINPATALGVADRLGSIEPSKDADLIIAAGDPLDARTEVKQLVIGGRAIDMANWWQALYDKFKSRPE